MSGQVKRIARETNVKIWSGRLPIAVRTGGAIATIAALCAIFMAIYFPLNHKRLARSGLEVRATVASRIVRPSIGAALDFDDEEALKEGLKVLSVDSDFSFAAVYDASGREVATRFTSGEHAAAAKDWFSSVDGELVPETRIVESGYGLEVHEPVVSESGRKATLVAGFTFDTIKKQSAEARNQILMISLALMLAGFGLAYVLGRSINVRIARVVRTANRLAEGAIMSEEILDSNNDEIADITRSFNALNRNMKQLTNQVSEIAAGNLSETVELEGELASALNKMIVSQRELVRKIADTATQLNTSSGEFFANAKQQERGATTQSTAVEQVRKTLESLLRSAREIGATADDVLRSAERSQGNSQNVAERIATLSSHNRRIAEILEIIKDIANKSELLALNAGLEGTKAGEAGRGFSLVASQMQRLAENVMGAVRDIKELTATITDSTDSTVLATEESTKLATDTTRWARQIGLIIQQQQTGTEQATKAMEDVGEVAAQTVSGSTQIVDSATDLMNLSQTLQALVGRFRLNRGSASDPRLIRDAAE